MTNYNKTMQELFDRFYELSHAGDHAGAEQVADMIAMKQLQHFDETGEEPKVVLFKQV